MAAPRGTPLTKKRSEVTPPSASAAAAVTVTGRPRMEVEPAAGALMATVGAVPPPTVTVTGALVVRLPPLSVATAVRT